MSFGCIGNTIRLRSGRYLDLKNPRPESIAIEDIACGLSKICRFGGQIEQWFSVAEHSILCSSQASADGRSTECQLAVLMHDAAEAFVGDVVKPLKEMLTDFEEIEHRINLAIEKKFGIDYAAHRDVIKEIDRAMLIAERKILCGIDGVKWAGEDEVRELRIYIFHMDNYLAEKSFVNIFNSLMAG